MDSPLLVHLFYDFHCISKKIAQFLIILSTNILFDDLFIVAPDLWYYFIDILKTVLRVLLFIVVMYYAFTNMPFWYLYKYSELDNPKTSDEKRKKLRDEIVHYEARWIVFLIIILILVIVRKFTNFFF